MNRLACYFRTPETVNLPILLSPPGNQVMCEWHSVKNRLPTPLQDVHVAVLGEFETETGYYDGSRWLWADNSEPIRNQVTAWAEFPELPKGAI